MNAKEILHKVKNVFIEAEEEINLSENTQEEIVETTDELKETEVEIEQEVELAEESEEPSPKQEPVVEYATKVELQEFQKTIMDILEKMQKINEDKKDVPEDLSSQEVELKEEEVEEISHSPEVEVEKKHNFTNPQANQNTLKSRIYNQLFS